MDRNNGGGAEHVGHLESLSARRAWIEISVSSNFFMARFVALRKESVDRNLASLKQWPNNGESLSARRAWIEIGQQ